MDLRSCRIDLSRQLVWRDRGSLSLTATEARLLAYLVANRGRVVSNEELLEQVFGYRPGVRSRTVATTVRRLREKIEADPAEPDHVLTVYGTGYRFESLATDAPAPLLGRADDVARFSAMRERLVTIVGPAGVGKTRFAQAWLAEHAGVFVDLRPATSPAEIARCLAGAMRVRLSPRASLQHLGEILDAGGIRHVVLDNMEHLAARAGDTVLALAAAAPDTVWVVTSREPLGVAGEVVFPLPPLAEDDGVALLVEVGRRARPGARFDDTEALGAIVRRLDGLPLAIEVVGARLGVMSARELHARLTSLGMAGLDPGGRSSEAIAWSWGLLDADEREVLAQVAVFRGSFSLGAAEGLADPDRQAAVPAVLQRLAARSLVRVAEAGSRREVRFSLYEAVRAFAAAHEPPGVRARLARWYAAHAGDWIQGAFAEDGTEWESAVPDELANVLDALDAADGSPDLRARLALAADSMLHRTGPVETGLAVLDGALATPGLSGADRAALLAARSRMHRYAGSWAHSEDDARAALAGEEGGLARARIYTAVSGLMIESGRPLSAIEACDRILALAPDDPELAAVAYADRASARYLLGHTEEAARDYAEAARVVAPHNRYRLALVLVNHGGVEAELGRYDRALPLLLRSTELLGQLRGYEGHLAAVLGNLAHVYVEQQQTKQAGAALDRTLALARRARYRRVEGIAALTAAVLAQECGRADEAAARVQEAQALLAGVDPWYEAWTHLVWGGLDHERGWLPSAAAHYETASTIARAQGASAPIALAAVRLAVVHGTWGLFAEAEVDEDLAGRHDAGLHAPAVAVHAAHLAVLRGEPERGRAALAWAEALSPGGPGPTPAAWSSPVRLAVRLLREALRHVDLGAARAASSVAAEPPDTRSA